MSDNYTQYRTVYDTNTVNAMKERGWEVVTVVNGTEPHTQLPAPAFIMGQLPKPEHVG
ncbi:hypothetical protein [Pseudomonas putida]|uniref:hypothetical protein n=1 Tax=Pseudomonas putida TaxID=303 RepID=UPI000AF25D49|nr:hypothetical protein [Pseudomonas putida]